ncbi:metallophosphoesterase domain-containing protein 1 [Linnemannia gamsii]|uniref:Metallophosphoesterase domain-containing protein 1 n=1 Tax=Linnemannia gamsii TaxID=64522 RepID=A0ABQ7JLE5_9FUNG|nr:metallophosphoesterase domain-containing protein 1 [Linnemannia gamsii]
MDFDHPIRTLKLGTIQANARRGISRNITQSAEVRSVLVQGIRSCFQQVAKQASMAKRTLHCAIGLYLESLSARKIDEMDKSILRKLCSDFTVEENATYNDSTNQQIVGKGQDQEHEPNSRSVYNEQEPFLQILLNAIINTTQPALPVANQVYVELKKHYKNGSMELCRKIESLKKKLLPAEATGTFDPSLSAIENFLYLNRVCGWPRCLVPTSSMEDRFITLMEHELVELFWRHPEPKYELQCMAFGNYTTIATPAKVSQADVRDWSSFLYHHPTLQPLLDIYPPSLSSPNHIRHHRTSELFAQTMEEFEPLLPNVHVAFGRLVDKPGPNWLRMVCISDTHNKTDANNYHIPEADVLVHAGDFTKMGTTAQIDQFIDWLKSLTQIPIKIVVAGNHDVVLDKEFYEQHWHRFHTTKEDHQVAVDKLKAAGHGIIYLNNEGYIVNGAQLLHEKNQEQKNRSSSGIMTQHMDTTGGDAMDIDVSSTVDPREGWVEGYRIWASPWQPEFWEWAFNEVRGKLKDIWKHIPEDTDILMTHGPPKYHGDIVPHDKNLHVGCEELLERLKVVRPLYHVFGHIHEGYGVSKIEWDEEDRSTVCINASTCTVNYKPLNPPIIVDLPPK